MKDVAGMVATLRKSHDSNAAASFSQFDSPLKPLNLLGQLAQPDNGLRFIRERFDASVRKHRR